MLPLSRKSVEPMAVRVDPQHATARHQALHHFVAKAEWFHTEMLRRVAQWVSSSPQAFQPLTWREGINAPLSGRFATVRVRHVGGNVGKARLRPEQWLLIEWPASDQEPSKYVLSTFPRTSASTNSFGSLTDAGALSVTTRISSMTSASAITKAEVDEGSTTMPR